MTHGRGPAVTVAATCFYEPLGDDRYRSTEHTVGPWDEAAQHGGPPAALLARALERTGGHSEATVTRMTVDILGPVPVADVRVRTRVLRSGRSVELVEAELDSGGRAVMRATAWRIRRAALELPSASADEGGGGRPVPSFPETPEPAGPGWGGGYLSALEWRPVAGRPFEPGPATIWARMRFPLVAGEEPTGLQRVMVVADSGNGVSSVLPIDRWLFINTDLSVHLLAVPVGEWICLDARTHVDEAGFGLAASRLFDRDRLVARGAQTLYVAPR